MRALALLVLVGCTAGKPTPPEPAPAPAPEPTVLEKPVAPEPEPPSGPQPWGDFYTVMGTPTLKGMALTVDVRYGGGCQTHVFTPRPGPRTAAAPTVQPVVLHHEANGDTCRALKYEHLTIPLDDLLGSDCTESLLLVTPAAEDGKPERVLPLTNRQGCD